MYCPTCASPLPVGAMFCGECGRAVSSADLAAGRRRAAAAAEHVEAASSADLPEPAPRATTHPRRSDGAEPPWWVRDRQAEPAPVPPVREAGRTDHPDETDGAAPDEAHPPRPASVPEPPTWPVGGAAASPALLADGGADVPQEARAGSTGTSPSASPPATPNTETPTPLRSPPQHPENGPRPTSAPLWTASLTPVEGEVRPSPATVDDEAPGSSTVEPAASDDRADDGIEHEAEDVTEAEAEAETETGESSVAVEAGIDAVHGSSGVRGDDIPPAHDERRDHVAEPRHLVHPTDSPQDGDTAPVAALDPDVRRASPVGGTGEPVVRAESVEAGRSAEPADPVDAARPAPVPLVEPAPLVEPDAVFVPERCTQCGASIGEDDIFCGECGAVVQSVALSFTGPIVPLAPGWRPDDEADDGRGAGVDLTGVDGAEVDLVSDDRGGPGDDDQRPTPRPAPEPIDHVPGFRVERPAVVPRPTVADLPPAPSSSSAPSWRPRRPLVDLPTDDDVDETRIVRRSALGSQFVLQFSTGESIAIDGTGLVGRAPAPQPGESFDQLVRIVDPGKSVSKTHLEFGQEGGALWVSDRWSGNGTVVRPRDLPPRRADPGVRVRVTRGTRVEIGEQFFVVV